MRLAPDRIAGFLFVLVLHAGALYGLWSHRILFSSQGESPLFVNFIAPPAPENKPEPSRPLPPKRQAIQPPVRQLVAEAPAVTATDYLAPPLPQTPAPAVAPVVEAPPVPLPTEPVRLAAELSVACPERSAPTYPASSRRFGEEGTVVLRVELDETGEVASARIQSSSGFTRLDDAALGAVRTWRCTPARRNGQPVRAVALQPFKFVLQGN